MSTENTSAVTSGAPVLTVCPGPHVTGTASFTTRRMMHDVLIALAPLVLVSVYVFRLGAVVQMALGVVAALVAETLFLRMRGRRPTLSDGSAAVTGLILALSLPAGAPWYVAVVGSFVAIGIGKVVFGGLGQNIFNPAMVGRAFAMMAFPAFVGASAYVDSKSAVDVLTQSTPLTALKQMGQSTDLGHLFLGLTNGSIGETSALAALMGGLYLCLRRTASWEIPAGVLLAALLVGGIINLSDTSAGWTFLHELSAGALVFGAFFIATDPVSSPLTHKGKFVFGVGVGLLVMMIRKLSGYPEGVMFAVLLMNALVPLINRRTIPVPVGGPVPERKG